MGRGVSLCKHYSGVEVEGGVTRWAAVEPGRGRGKGRELGGPGGGQHGGGALARWRGVVGATEPSWGVFYTFWTHPGCAGGMGQTGLARGRARGKWASLSPKEN